MMKKIITIALCLISLMGVMHSCGNSQGEKKSLNKQMIEAIHENIVSVLEGADVNQYVQRSWVMKDLDECLFVYNERLEVFFFVDKDGNTLYQPICNQYSVNSSINNKLLFVREDGKYNGKIGLMNLETGEIVQPFVYSENSDWINGVAVILDENGQFGMLDSSGKVIIPIGKYNQILPLNNGAVLVDNGGALNLLDTQGKLLVELTAVEDINVELSDDFIAMQKEGKWGAINEKGKTVLPFEYDQIIAEPNPGIFNGMFEVKKDGKVGFVDKKGEVVIPCEYEERGFLSNFDNGFSFKKNGKSGVVDYEGNIVWPFEFDAIFDASDKLVCCEINGKIGVMNKDGKWISEQLTRYGFPMNIYGNTVEVFEGNKAGLIDSKGEMVLPCEYDRIEGEEKGLLSSFKSDTELRYSLYNKDGEVLAQYAGGIPQIINEKFVQTIKSGAFGIKDTNGKEIAANEYENIHFVEQDGDVLFVTAHKKDGTDIYNMSTGKKTYSTSYDLENNTPILNGFMFSATDEEDNPLSFFFDKQGNFLFEIEGCFLPKEYK